MWAVSIAWTVVSSSTRGSEDMRDLRIEGRAEDPTRVRRPAAPGRTTWREQAACLVGDVAAHAHMAIPASRFRAGAGLLRQAPNALAGRVHELHDALEVIHLVFVPPHAQGELRLEVLQLPELAQETLAYALEPHRAQPEPPVHDHVPALRL